jgi:hypothetical protein
MRYNVHSSPTYHIYVHIHHSLVIGFYICITSCQFPRVTHSQIYPKVLCTKAPSTSIPCVGTSWRSSGRLQSGLVLSLLKRAGDRGRKRGVCGNVVAGRDKWDSEESMGGCVEFHAWHVFIAASSRPHVSYSYGQTSRHVASYFSLIIVTSYRINSSRS